MRERPVSSSVEVTESRGAKVGPLSVQRALPTRGRRTVGSWCFADHMGPLALSPEQSVDVAPHPHIGLQTVTWLFSGEFVHRDSLGSEQIIRPGQLNLMSAGHGVAHSEENPGLTYGHLHGVQLWVAQPDSTRDTPAQFEHHAQLAHESLDNGTLTVMVGAYEQTTSPARISVRVPPSHCVQPTPLSTTSVWPPTTGATCAMILRSLSKSFDSSE